MAECKGKQSKQQQAIFRREDSMLETVRGKKWLGLAIALVALVAFACGTKEVVKTVEIKVPGETVVVEKEVIKEVQVEVVVEKEVVKEVMVPGETIVVEKEVVKTVEVPGARPWWWRKRLSRRSR